MRKFNEKVSANYRIQLRPDRVVENAFRAYETSWETERLESERSRQVYGELIDLGRRKSSENISGNPEDKSTAKIVVDKWSTDDKENDSDEEEQLVPVVEGETPKWWTSFSVDGGARPGRLTEIAAREIARQFEKGSLDDRVWCQDAVDFGLNADIELNILNLLELDVKQKVLQLPKTANFSFSECYILEAIGGAEDQRRAQVSKDFKRPEHQLEENRAGAEASRNNRES